ncbi:hypothetical protein TNCV_4442061 [Trichonephila clavipes]|nr:hypothetical protein TNCV_4442061 [Trichonephila clavipes]
MFNQPANCQPGLVRGTVVLLENSITMRITEQSERMEVIPQQLNIPNCIVGGFSLADLGQAKRTILAYVECRSDTENLHCTISIARVVLWFQKLFADFPRLFCSSATELNRSVFCMVLKATANDWRTSSPLPR